MREQAAMRGPCLRTSEGAAATEMEFRLLDAESLAWLTVSALFKESSRPSSGRTPVATIPRLC